MRQILTFVFAILLSTAAAQIDCGKVVDESQVAFAAGEELSYNVEYSASIFSTSVADVKFRTTVEGGQYLITANGKTRPFYSVFFEMEDVYHTWLDKSTLRPNRTTSKIKEGGYRYQTTFTYNWANNTVHTFGHNIKNGNTYNKTMPLRNCSFDALSLFYNLRCIDIATLKTGTRYKLNLVLEDTIRTINYRIIGNETRKIEKVGSFRTIKVACQIATNSGDALKDGSEFYIWLSDDKNRIPIYMESPIRVGNIKVYLSSWANLKHQFSSIIVN